jgi:hypothetical protein
MSTEPDVKRSDILPIGTPFHSSPRAVWEVAHGLKRSNEPVDCTAVSRLVAIQDVLFFTPLP